MCFRLLGLVFYRRDSRFSFLLLQLSALQKLNLAKNFLEVLPPTLRCLTRLTFLSLWGNRLSRLPEGFYLGALHLLDLSRNHFSALPRALAAAGALRELGLAANPIRELAEEDSKVLHKLGQLRLLDFGSGKMGRGRGATSDLEVALLWVLARAAPGCDISFNSSPRFMVRFS
jgi:hypothetical protein